MTTKAKRFAGFYWIKLGKTWTPGAYNAEKDRWYVIGAAKAFQGKELTDIGGPILQVLQGGKDD